MPVCFVISSGEKFSGWPFCGDASSLIPGTGKPGRPAVPSGVATQVPQGLGITLTLTTT